MLDEIFRKIAYEIGQFYIQKCENDYDKAGQNILNLQITDIKVGMGLRVTLCTNRPGLLIGRRGEDITALEAHLKERLNISSLRIEENKDHILNHMLPYKEDDYDPIEDANNYWAAINELEYEIERSEPDRLPDEWDNLSYIEQELIDKANSEDEGWDNEVR